MLAAKCFSYFGSLLRGIADRLSGRPFAVGAVPAGAALKPFVAVTRAVDDVAGELPFLRRSMQEQA